MAKPVAHRFRHGNQWHYLDDSDPFPSDGGEPLFTQDQLDRSADGAYKERNVLVALLSKLYPSGRKKTAIPGWDEAWHGCVYIDFPWGQASWHFHERDAYLFEHLPPYLGEWDGHTTAEKYSQIVAASPLSIERQRRAMYEAALDMGAPGYLPDNKPTT